MCGSVFTATPTSPLPPKATAPVALAYGTLASIIRTTARGFLVPPAARRRPHRSPPDAPLPWPDHLAPVA